MGEECPRASAESPMERGKGAAQVPRPCRRVGGKHPCAWEWDWAWGRGQSPGKPETEEAASGNAQPPATHTRSECQGGTSVLQMFQNINWFFGFLIMNLTHGQDLKHYPGIMKV